MVLQGMDGDGLINTVDTSPNLNEQCAMIPAVDNPSSPNEGVPRPVTPPSFSPQQSQPNSALQQALDQWHTETCVQNATEEATEWLQLVRHKFATPSGNNGNSPSSPSRSPKPASPVPILTSCSHRFWLRQAQLLVFQNLPQPETCLREVGPEDTSCTNDCSTTVLFPGSIVMGVALHTFEFSTSSNCSQEPSSSWKYKGQCNQCRCHGTLTAGRIHSGLSNDDPPAELPLAHWPKAGRLQFLEIQASPPVVPHSGFVLFSVDGYSVFAPGLPTSSLFTGLSSLESSSSDSSTTHWWWKVSYAAGAVVRETVDLKSNAVGTLPYGTYVQVTQKVINAAGLSRLRIRAALQPTDPSQTSCRVLEGWCSELLNPLSGERGPIVQPLPLPIPTLFRVVPAPPTSATRLSSSTSGVAVVRERVDLASPVVRHMRTTNDSSGGCSPIPVLGRRYTQVPPTDCLPRVRLGPQAFASLYLNTTPPRRYPIMQPTGRVDDRFDPTKAGLYHFQVIYQDYHGANTNDGAMTDINTSSPTASCGTNPRTSSCTSTATTSSSSSCEVSPASPQSTSPLVAPSSLCANAGHRNPICVCCLAKEADATLIHGDTGHICCCLECARICKAQSLGCPLCRKPITAVIQHYYS